MWWIGTSLVALIVALVVVGIKRPADMGELGSVSDRWIAEHRGDFP
jgi:hypothetical protein